MSDDDANEEDKKEESPRKKDLSMRGPQQGGMEKGDSGYNDSTVKCQVCGAEFLSYEEYKQHFDSSHKS